MEVLEACIVQMRVEELTCRMESYVIIKNGNIWEKLKSYWSVFLKNEMANNMCTFLDLNHAFEFCATKGANTVRLIL